jgi:hypothetical protein
MRECPYLGDTGGVIALFYPFPGFDTSLLPLSEATDFQMLTDLYLTFTFS